MLLCIKYGILFVDTVNTKIKACNALSAIFVETVDTTVKTHPYIAFLIFNGFSIHKKFWKAEIQGFSTIPSNTICLTSVMRAKLKEKIAFPA